MKVSEIMTREPATIGPDATLGEAATLMKQQDCGSIPVVENGRLVGIVTDRDIVIRAVAAGEDPKKTRAAGGGSAAPITVAPGGDGNGAGRDKRGPRGRGRPPRRGRRPR